jgi:hypothetical protein
MSILWAANSYCEKTLYMLFLSAAMSDDIPFVVNDNILKELKGSLTELLGKRLE